MVKSHQLSIWILLSLFLAVAFNNCGQFIEKDKNQVSSSSLEKSYPWPNSTTTISDSDSIASKVVFSDYDGDYYEDAVFLSNSSSPTIASIKKPILRLVSSGAFQEVDNIENLITQPNPRVKMLLTDVDMDEGQKELIYLSQDSQSIVAIEISGPNRGLEKFKIDVIEPIDRRVENAFSEKHLGNQKLIEVGSNMLFIDPINGLSVQSSLQKVDGAWSAWSNWSSCSKSCGDGIISRMRLCTSPAPLNGGAYCSGSATEIQTCRKRACTASDCGTYEMLQNGSCVLDPNNPPPSTGGTTGGVGTGGGTSGGDTTSTQPGTCPAGKAWDPYFFSCFTPYPLNNIWLTYRQTIPGGQDNDTQIIDHTYRLSLSHPKATAMGVRETAAEYCRFRGYVDVMSYTTGTYQSGLSGASQNAYVLCNIATNGLYYGRGGCMVGNYMVSFTYSGITHPQGQNVTYLKSVVCRKDQ